MSGPCEPSTGRAEKATHCPSALYAGGAPMRTTASAIATAEARDGAGVGGGSVGDSVASPGLAGGLGSGDASGALGSGDASGALGSAVGPPGSLVGSPLGDGETGTGEVGSSDGAGEPTGGEAGSPDAIGD